MMATTFKCPFCDEQHPLATLKCPRELRAVPAVFKLHGAVIDGKYEIMRVIGEGGMGIVYEGRHRIIGRKVAIKFLYPEIKASREALARFQNEAKIAAAIAHKNIVDIFDMGTTDEKIPFIVMEYLLGYSLEDILKMTTVLSQSMAVDIILEVLSALNAVHGRGIIHRDLKPDNIFLVEQAGGEDIVKVLDFGICHLSKSLMGGDQSYVTTESGYLIGSPRYMSPEQALGDANIDNRADLYAVGVILYRMLTGRFPFEGDNYNQLIVSIAIKQPVPPRQHNPDISPRMEELILRTISKNRQDRFSSAAELAGYLAAFKAPGSGREARAPSMVTSLPADVLARIRQDTGSIELDPAALRQPGIMVSRPPDAPAPGAGTGPSPAPLPPADGLPDTEKIPKPGKVPAIEPARAARPAARAAQGSAALAGRSRNPWKIVSAVLFLLLLVTLGLSFFFRDTPLSTVFGAGRQSAAGGGGSDPAPGQTRKCKVTLEGIPLGASVYVDGVLRSDRPIHLEASDAPRPVKITAPGYSPWERSMRIDSDVTLLVFLTPLNN